MRYISQLKKNLISNGALETQSLRGTLGKRSYDVKGIQHNNLYYLKDSVVIENLVASECLDDDSTGYGMRLGHTDMNSLHTLAK